MRLGVVLSILALVAAATPAMAQQQPRAPAGVAQTGIAKLPFADRPQLLTDEAIGAKRLAVEEHPRSQAAL